jgi:hypothetical protein
VTPAQRDALLRAKTKHERHCLDMNTGRSPWRCECQAEAQHAIIDSLLDPPDGSALLVAI